MKISLAFCFTERSDKCHNTPTPTPPPPQKKRPPSEKLVDFLSSWLQKYQSQMNVLFNGLFSLYPFAHFALYRNPLKLAGES